MLAALLLILAAAQPMEMSDCPPDDPACVSVEMPYEEEEVRIDRTPPPSPPDAAEKRRIERDAAREVLFRALEKFDPSATPATTASATPAPIVTPAPTATWAFPTYDPELYTVPEPPPESAVSRGRFGQILPEPRAPLRPMTAAEEAEYQRYKAEQRAERRAAQRRANFRRLFVEHGDEFLIFIIATAHIALAALLLARRGVATVYVLLGASLAAATVIGLGFYPAFFPDGQGRLTPNSVAAYLIILAAAYGGRALAFQPRAVRLLRLAQAVDDPVAPESPARLPLCPSATRLGRGDAMRWLSDYAAVWFFGTFVALLIVDIFAWSTHPFAVLTGGALAYLTDPVLLAVAALLGATLGGTWKAMLAGVPLAALLEIVSVNSAYAEALGHSHFDLDASLARVVSISFVLSLFAAAKYVIARRDRADA